MSRSGRVLLFIDALLKGGAERLVVQLAERLDSARFDAAVACFRQEAFAEELSAAGRPCHVVPKRRPFDLALLFRLLRLLRRERIAVVHAHDIQSGTYGTVAARLSRRPVVLTVHGLGIFRQKRAASLLPRLGRWAHRVVFVGEWLKRAAADEFGLRPRHATVIHNGVDVSAFRPGEPAPEVAAELDVPRDSLVVGSVGNLRAVKDVPTLIRGFARATQRVPNAVLVLVGDGPERPALEQLVSGLGLSERVRFAGARSDVARLLPLFDVFALASKTEGISVALLEAMACGLPTVATRTGGNPEVVVEGQTGRLVPVDEPEELGNALTNLLLDAQTRRSYGRRARQRVEEHFSLDRMVQDYESLYAELL